MPTHQDLLQDVRQLAARFPDLGTRLSLAAGELKNLGTPPAAALLDELQGYQQAFRRLCDGALVLAKSGGISGSALPANIISVRELEAFLQSLAPGGSLGGAPTGSKARALAVLDRFLGLRYDGPEATFEPLEVCQGPAQQLRQLLLGETTAALPSAVDELASGRHPVCHLLQLVDGAGDLDDEVWLKLQDSVTAALGRSMTAAALRGRLVAGAAPSPLPPAGAPPKMTGPVTVPLEVIVHVSGTGDLRFRGGDYAGTRGEGRSLEGFAIEFGSRVPGLGIRYMGHVQDRGDLPWVGEGNYVGTRGEGLRLEGFAIELTGPEATKYDVRYVGHFARFGDSNVVANGEFCGIRGQSLAIESMKIWIEPKR